MVSQGLLDHITEDILRHCAGKGYVKWPQTLEPHDAPK